MVHTVKESDFLSKSLFRKTAWKEYFEGTVNVKDNISKNVKYRRGVHSINLYDKTDQ